MKGCIRKYCQQVKGGDLPPLLNTAETHQECCVQCWAPWYKRDTGILEQVQPRVMKMTEEFEHPSYEERLRELGVFCLEKRRLREILSTCVNTQWVGAKRLEPGSSYWVSMEGQWAQMKYRKFPIIVRKNFSIVSIAKC